MANYEFILLILKSLVQINRLKFFKATRRAWEIKRNKFNTALLQSFFTLSYIVNQPDSLRYRIIKPDGTTDKGEFPSDPQSHAKLKNALEQTGELTFPFKKPITLINKADSEFRVTIEADHLLYLWPDIYNCVTTPKYREYPIPEPNILNPGMEDPACYEIISIPDSVALFFKNGTPIPTLACDKSATISSSEGYVSKNLKSDNSNTTVTTSEQQGDCEKLSGIKLKVQEYFAFMRTRDLRKNEYILSVSDYNKLVEWVTYFFENDYSIPQIDNPINKIYTSQGNIVYTFISLFDDIKGKGTRPNELFELIRKCFHEYRNKIIANLKKATTKPQNYS